MASIRRTLSPVPRAGTSMNGEACQVPSPLSKSSSSSSQNLQTSRGLLSSLLGLSDSHPLVLGVFSSPTRSSKPLDKSIWRKPLFHFFVCFVAGIFMGFMNSSSNPIIYNSQEAVSFEMVSTVKKFDIHSHKGMAQNTTSSSPSVGDQVKLDELMVGKLLIVVTGTYARPFQEYYLNRLVYTLRLVQPPLLWIVVEMTSQSEQTADLLRRSGVMYRHLVCNKNLTDINHRNVNQRNLALSHIETHRLDGIVYFADDDNIYLADLFEHLRHFRRFGTWIVAKLTGSQSKGSLEGPICNGSRVIGWHAQESSRRLRRRFHADMSGFAFNSTILWDPKRWHRPTLEPIRLLDTVRDGFQASRLIEQVVEDESQMEGLGGENCSRVMVWQLHLESLNSLYPPKWFTISNLDVTTRLA